MDLTGRVALVTGAGSAEGIGFATATALGELGAHVIITSTTDRIQDRVAELESAGISATGVIARLEEASLVDRFASELDRLDLRPDILVNNAGMVMVGDDDGMASGDITMGADEWQRGLAMNLTSAFLVTRLCIPAMRERGWGRVVNVASTSGAVQALRGDVAYSAAKAGLLGLTRALAVDEATHGITANAVAPGWIATASQLETEAIEGTLVPMGRSGTSAEVGSAISWLCTPGASYVTGQLVVIDGGNSVAEEHRR
ncbi:SDR family oxidoreductase [Naasia lichenicola]|uniref:SDR family oxidoreductase n=2 Tax=Naasia lichenicola TaxID=2565933 RepID=A0A4S4FT47_9MICO|nr:SDR family oxidoreductase [Naasia lichenicola]